MNYSPEGADVDDEAIACTEAVTINSTTYYRGQATQLAANSVLGDTSPSYGAWTAASKGGTRLTVVESPGLPADGDEVAWDLVSGYLYSTTSRTLYVYYRGHGSLARAIASPIGLTRQVRFPGLADTVTAAGDEWQMTMPGTAPTSYQIVGYEVAHTAMALGPGGGDPTIVTIADVAPGGSPVKATVDISIPEDERRVAYTTLATPVPYAAGETLYVYLTQAPGMHADIEITLDLEVVNP